MTGPILENRAAGIDTGGAPTTVTLRDGTKYLIPAGAWGTFPWVRQANLIATAYRDIGDGKNHDRWAAEYQRRTQVWNDLESGKDARSVLLQFGKDLVQAPLKILADVGSTAIGIADKATKAAFKLTDLLVSPWFWLGVGAVAVLIFSPIGNKLVKKVTG